MGSVLPLPLPNTFPVLSRRMLGGLSMCPVLQATLSRLGWVLCALWPHGVWCVVRCVSRAVPHDPLRPSPSGKPFDPTIVVSRSVANIICSVMFGSRFNYDDERLLTIIRLINDNFQIMSSPWGEVRRPSSASDGVSGTTQHRD